MIDTEKHKKERVRIKRQPLDKKMIAVKVLRILVTVLLVLVACVAGLLEFLTLTEYKPLTKEPIAVDGISNAAAVSPGSTLTVMSWNTGYAALGDNADFFMDGGESVMTSDHDRVVDNLQGIVNEIAQDNPDVLFLQEVDRDSKRSYRINEEIWLTNSLMERYGTDYSTAFAYNFKVAYVPYPIPMLGRVQSGLMTLTKYGMTEAERIQLPCPFKWPVRLANLKRCLLVERIPLANTKEEDAGKELVLINLHLEAYDDGEGKAEQTRVLREVLDQEVQKGNYVIAGGDFNQVFSNQDMSKYPAQEGEWTPGMINVEEMGASLSCLMDGAVPSCRSLRIPYTDADHSTFQYYLIDGFIVSDNVKVESIVTKDLGFVVSDHNPVIIKCTLEGEPAAAPTPKKAGKK